MRETGFKLIAAIVKVPGEGGAVSMTLINLYVLHIVSDIVFCMWSTAKCTCKINVSLREELDIFKIHSEAHLSV